MNKGILAASLSTIFIGFSVVISSATAKLIHPLTLITIGYLLSIAFLFILSKIIKERLEIRKLFSFKKDLLSVVILRSIIGQILLIFGFSMVPAIRAVFLLQIEPAFVFITSVILLKEKLKVKSVLYILILILGALIFTTNGSFNILTQITPGDLLIITALVFLAYTYLPSSNLSKKLNSNTITLGANLIPPMIFLPIILIFIPTSLIIDLSVFYLIILYALTFYVLGLFLWFRSLKNTKPWIVASILSLQPVAGALLAFFWLGEVLSTIQLIGAVIMIVTANVISRENLSTKEV